MQNTLTPQARKKKIPTGLIIILIILLFIFRGHLVLASMNSFTFMNKLLYLGGSISHFAGWIILGLFTGLIYGCWVAYKKYNLKKTLMLLPVGIITLFLLILFLINDPLEAEADVAKAPTIQQDAYSLVEISYAGSKRSAKQFNSPDRSLIDSNDNTAWISGKEYPIAAQKIQFTFKPSTYRYKNCKCIGFRIKNGYTKSQKKWKEYNRVQSFYLYYNDNFITSLNPSDLFNTDEMLSIQPIPVKGGDILTLTISSVYTNELGKTSSTREIAITNLVPVIAYSPQP